MAIERVVDTSIHEDDSDEKIVEVSLRPTTFGEYIGQRRLKTNLKLAIDAAKKRGDVMDHVLLYGPPGLGKTTMAGVIAHEMNANFRATAAPSIEKAGDLASILTNLADGDILFIDEIHRLRRAVEEILYSAMEDYKLDIVIGKGPAARSVKLDLPRFTLIGATTQTGNLAAPLRDRFGHAFRLEYYANNDIRQIIERSAKILDTKIEPAAADLLAQRARLTPRIANRLLKRVRDYADVNGDGIIDTAIAHDALRMLEIDELGLDVRAFFKDLGEVGHVLKIVADGKKHLALRILDDLAGAHARMVDGIGTVVGIAEDQVLLLAIDGFGYVLPADEYVGAVVQILHDLHVVVVESRRVLGRIDVERDLLGPLLIDDWGLGIFPLVAVFGNQGVHSRALAVVRFLVSAASAGGQGEDHRKNC